RHQPRLPRRPRAHKQVDTQADAGQRADDGVHAELLGGAVQGVAVGCGQVVLEVLLGELGEVVAGVAAEHGERVGRHFLFFVVFGILVAPFLLSWLSSPKSVWLWLGLQIFEAFSAVKAIPGALSRSFTDYVFNSVYSVLLIGDSEGLERRRR
ncbi:hypothetical protein MPH_05332, partial [Macrophomina phaseolina MS6]